MDGLQRDSRFRGEGNYSETASFRVDSVRALSLGLHGSCMYSLQPMPSNNRYEVVLTTMNYTLPNPMGTKLYVTVVHNVRDQEHNFSLDRNGFQFLVHHTTESFQDKSSIETGYYAEVRDLLMQQTGAHRVLVLGHRLRQGSGNDALPANSGNWAQARPPSYSVHADRTPESVIATVRARLGQEAEGLLQGRVRFINVWRPVGHKVYCEPLAMVDWQSCVDMSDLLPIRVDTADAKFEAFITRAWYLQQARFTDAVGGYFD
ncbi:hypothetical protein RSOLAG22IIIB_13041 [Rhizoctonia solani]|uniref:Uncharacterized protein n=1 Tax=Rhizoctonia solani TaxID=456999 RepID=A0A0K6GIL3_9AGAM|nr:hypothetical protein RSOLAG22IIIB_13041 [Rhizoctonia solani]